MAERRVEAFSGAVMAVIEIMASAFGRRTVVQAKALASHLSSRATQCPETPR
jgi:hypothetical protein